MAALAAEMRWAVTDEDGDHPLTPAYVSSAPLANYPFFDKSLDLPTGSVTCTIADDELLEALNTGRFAGTTFGTRVVRFAMRIEMESR